MKMSDTVQMMNSADYKERLRLNIGKLKFAMTNSTE